MSEYRQKTLIRYDQTASWLVYHSDALSLRLSALVKQFPRVALAALLIDSYIGVLTYTRFSFVVIIFIPFLLLPLLMS